MKISDLLEYALFLAGTLTICFSLPQGLKNAVKAEHEKIYQKVEKKSIDKVLQTDRMPLP